MDFYKNFVKNIYTLDSEYNNKFNRFPEPLPKPLQCPYVGCCTGGIDSTCHVGYRGTLCAVCSDNHYFRFNTCLECPRMVVTIISCVVVVFAFVAVFLLVLWGDSRRTEDNRTVADVVMSCCKIVIGFYQVISGIFSALVGVQWPIALISMEKYLKLVEGNIFQFAPLSCIQTGLRPDPFLQFVLAIGTNILVVLLIFLYLFLRKHYINKIGNVYEPKDNENIAFKEVMLSQYIIVSPIIIPNDKQEDYPHSAFAGSMCQHLLQPRRNRLCFPSEG